MAIHVSPCISMDVHGHPLLSVDLRMLSQIVIYPLRFSAIFVQVRSMAETANNTFSRLFGFLHPYIGVSGSLVSRKR